MSFIYPFFIKKYFEDIDVIKTNQMWGSWVGVILKFLLKKPLIIRCGYEIYRNELILNKNITKKIFYKYLSKLTYFYADQILVTTTSIRNFIINNFNISKSKILIQKNWVDTNKFKPSFSNNNLCIYVGRLSEEKNLIDLLNIIKGTKLKLNIYGEGPQKKYLQENIGLNNKQIYMHGTIQNDKLPSVMRKHNIFFLISKYEGQPKSLLEAMSCGLIVIGKNSLGIKDIIRHKKNGYLLKCDYSNLKEISNLIFGKKKNNLKLRNQARKYILKNHSLHKFLKIENNVYKKALNVSNF
jgi:glycosyltransferase involved in cell wall biosynthesis